MLVRSIFLEKKKKSPFCNMVDTCLNFLFFIFRLLNDVDYYGRFEQEDLDQVFEALQSNYKGMVLWVCSISCGR